MDDSQGGAPPSPNAAPGTGSPAPATPSPALDQGTKDLVEVVQRLRGIAKAYPSAAPAVAKINDLMREVAAAMMAHQSQGEPQAGPTG